MSGWTQSSIEGIAPAVRQAAENTGWKVREGSLSLIENGATFHASIFADTMNFRAKPIQWNEIYWSIMNMTFKRTPQATRHWTSFSLPVPIRAQAQVREGAADKAAAALIAFADTGKARTTTIDRLPGVRFAPDRDDDFQMARIVERLALGDPKGARDIAEGVVAGRIRSSFNHNAAGGSFFELARARIDDGVLERSA